MLLLYKSYDFNVHISLKGRAWPGQCQVNTQLFDGDKLNKDITLTTSE